MSLETWILFLFASVALSVTPGPNGLLSLNHGVRFGVRRAVFTALGSITGMSLLIAVSMAGLGAVLSASQTAFSVLKWIGAAYLVWLGIRMWRSPAMQLGSADSEALLIRPRTAFSHGFFVAISNPKALLFFATFLPQFVDPQASLVWQSVIFAVTFAAIEFTYEVLLAGAAGRLAPWIERHGRVFNRITGGAFVGVGAMVATSQR